MSFHQPLFILCPGRSFSSIACMTIGQHPQLYGLPETYLASAASVHEWFVFTSRPSHRHLRHGLLRIIAQLHHGAQTQDTVLEARRWLQQQRDWRTDKLYHYLAGRIAPQRLVDKSPTQGKLQNLERLHQAFPGAYFLHLTRHPRSTGNSFYRVKFAKAKQQGQLALDKLADKVEWYWVRGHRSILEFTARLPPGQVMRLQGENLLAEPNTYFLQIAEWLEIRTDTKAIEAMMHPEASPYAHVGPPGARYGNNRGFLENPHFKEGLPPPAKLVGPMEWSPEQSNFSPETLRIARQLGYD